MPAETESAALPDAVPTDPVPSLTHARDGQVELDPSNPFAQPSDLPYGLPPLDRVDVDSFRPAILAGIAQQRAEWEAIATDPAPVTFANTLEALERSGELLARATRTFWVYTSSVGGAELDALDAELSPLLSAHWDSFELDPRLLARYDALAAAVEDGSHPPLEPEAAWLLHRRREVARRAGVGLDEAGTARLRELNAEITARQTEFGQRVVAGMAAAAVAVDSEEELAGLSEGDRAALHRSAVDRGSAADHLVTLILPTPQPVLVDADSRELRRRVQRASESRGSGVDQASDTREAILALARARAERARLLGYPHHAAYVAAGATAGSTEAVMGILTQLAAPAVRNARAEAEDLQVSLAVDVPGATLEAADWAHYAERVRRERYDVDLAALRPYFELGRVLEDGVFWTATQLYGLTFTERFDLPTYADGMRVWEVRDADGAGLGLFLGDYYAREGKRGGAWMTSFVNSSRLLGTRPVVTNTLNVPRPPEGEPTLLTWDEVNTAFHEFGHALHGLLSDATYPSLSGTAVPRDFVEYPSQVNEMWATHPEVMARYARHHATGEPLAADVVARLQEAARYGEGFRTTEYLGAALLDQAWHQLTPEEVPTDVADVAAFEAQALSRYGVDVPQVPPRYRSTYFNHTFGGGYDAGYYSYIWSEVLDADTQAWFEEGENGGLDAARGRRFREALLSRGHTGDPLGFFRDLRGRDADLTPLLVRRGLQ
ncbi:M3 family metallopeptidase [Miniimonas arenae]|uniref:M3 family metallopeptidase n=1 Tax=Miniimonas arenae TaxID=676201 RepID=UPI0028A61BEE|nr:M3 family metallopeptidase [Miniimonas arenae]